MVESVNDDKMQLMHAKQHYGKSMMAKFLVHLKPLVKQALVKAEQDKGAPVQRADVKIALIEILKDHPQDQAHAGLRRQLGECLQDMWRLDELLVDELACHFSLKPQDKFWAFSDVYEAWYSKDYDLDDKLRFIPKSHMQVNFNWLKDLMLSKDLSRLGELRALGESPKMLDSTVDLSGNRISLPSFPRTGNTMLKTLIESCTGIHTGTDMDTVRTTNNVWMHGMMAQDHHAEDSVWVTKTHYPSGQKPNVDIANKIIYITRNPFEVFPSLAYLQTTNTHTLVSEKPINEYTDYWNFFVPHKADKIQKFHAHIMAQSEVTPTFFCRYEDLRENSLPVMMQMLAFMLDVNSIEGTVIEARVKEVCAEDVTAKARYALKTTAKNYNRNIHLYNQEQIDFCTSTLKDHNVFFGYAALEGVENLTGYFSYPNEDASEMANNFRKYKSLNDSHFHENGDEMGNIPRDKRQVWKVNEQEGVENMQEFMKKTDALLPDDFRTKMP